MENQIQQRIAELQRIEQNMQLFLQQKQQLQQQLAESDSALNELKKSEKAYRIIGNIMVDQNKDELLTEIAEKKERIEIRLKTVDSQEQQLREKSQKMQAELMASMQKGAENDKDD